MWANICKSNLMNIQKIFPLQQREVIQLVESVSKLPEVQKIIIFGSSITSACNPWSDLDVYIQMTKRVPIVTKIKTTSVDLWTNFEVEKDDELYKDIMEGVTVYEK